jgi:hypothetical protein
MERTITLDSTNPIYTFDEQEKNTVEKKMRRGNTKLLVIAPLHLPSPSNASNSL